MNITNEWQTNLSLISGECREAGDLLGAERLKLSFAAEKGRENGNAVCRIYKVTLVGCVRALIQDRPVFGIIGPRGFPVA